MANEMDFESFDNLGDLDWSELEKDIETKGKGAAPAPGGGAPMGDAGFDAHNAAPVHTGSTPLDINYLMDVNLEITVEVGRRLAYIREILDWDQGSIIELSREIGKPLDLIINGNKVARGEVVVINEKFALKIVDIVDPKDRLRYL